MDKNKIRAITVFTLIFNLIIPILFLFSCNSNSYYIYRNNKNFNKNKKSDNSSLENYDNELNSNQSSNSLNINTSKNSNLSSTKNNIPPDLVIPQYKLKVLLVLNIKNQYTVKKGDTLYSICKKFNITINDIKKINNIKNPDLIKPGQKIYIFKENLNFYNLSEKFELKLKSENILKYIFINSNIAFSPLEYGTIKFIGEIRGYGLSIIINIKNYFVILSGFEKIFVNINDRISLKSPLGSLKNHKFLYISIFQNNKIIKIGKIVKIK